MPSTRLRTIAACHAEANRPYVEEPFAQVHEDLAVMAWRSVQRLTPATAAQEPQAIAEMIEHLRGLQRGEGNG